MNATVPLSESRNRQTMNLDSLSTLELLQRFNEQDALVAGAVAKVLGQVAQAVDAASAALQNGGRMIYIGAGSSGRLGVLDAAECPPTFGVAADQVIGLIAGGHEAMFQAQEGAEDDQEAAEHDLQLLGLQPRDVVIGLAASGSTPYVVGGLRYASQLGCCCVAVCCNDHAPMAALAQFAIVPLVGPEVLAGSTRLKAGTAQKMVLNMLSTAVMVKCGRVWQNLMVDMKASNQKLRQRACRMVCEACGVADEQASTALAQTCYAVKPAILMLLAGCSAQQAVDRLAAHGGFLRAALQELHLPNTEPERNNQDQYYG